MTVVLNEHQQWVTNGGTPVVNGKVYYGVVNQDPKANPITIYADRLLTVVLANPQPTDSNGRTVNKVWVDGQYSLKLENSAGSQLYQQLDFGSDFVGGIISLKNIQGANTIVSNAIPFLTSLVDGQLFELTLAQTNTDDVTLKIDSQVAKPVLKNHTQQIGAGEFEENQKAVVIYNATDDVFEWVNQNNKNNVRLTGELTIFGNSTPPAGWLNCDGAAVSRVTFVALFAVIGETYGVGDGATTFNLPDMRGRSPLGEGTGSGLTARALGDSIGEEDHQLTEAELAAHTHTAGQQISTSPQFTGSPSDPDAVQKDVTQSGSTGGDIAHNNMQPSLVFNFIIKT